MPHCSLSPSNRSLFSGPGLVGAVVLLLVGGLLSVPPATAQQLNRVGPDVLQQARADVHGPDRTGKDGPLSTIGLELALLYREHQRFEQSGAAGPFESQALVGAAVQDDYVTVDVVAQGDPSTLESDLRRLGAQDVASFRSLVSARIPIDQVSEMATLSSLRGARIARASKPQETTSGASLTEDGSSPSAPLVGATDSQGDEAMNTDDVRASFGVDGAGTTVGVLSDSYDNSNVASTTADDDIASGDLPPSDRITVLDDEVPASDEGRAMMQLIYDVAPGTDLSFHTAAGGQANFAQGILDLANDGADVIVDDIFYFGEPFFQDGVIAQAVDQVAAQGVPYFSSAGNAARQSYASTSFNTVTVNQNDDTPVYDFDPAGATTDTLQQVTIPENGDVTISFQWDDPFFSVTGDPNFAADADLDIYLLDKQAADTLASSTIDNVAFGDPVEIVGFFNDGSVDADGDGTADETFQIKIEKSGGSDPGRIKYFWSGVMSVDEFATDSPTSRGHSIASGGAGVAAAFYQNTPAFGTSPPQPEGFTSLGGIPILFNTDGTRKSSPEIRNQPRFTAPDGTNTTFFGSADPASDPCCEGDDFPNFFGTSAAAPHAAAVAALQLQANPGQSPSQIYTGLANGAVDMTSTSGFDFLTGAGLIDASQTITSTANEPNIEFEPTADVDFGDRFFDQDAGALFSPPSITVRARNVGTAPLEITNVTLSGGAFTASGGISTGPLAEDEEATATLTFDPSSTGSFTGSYEIESDDPDTPTVSLGLAGNALLPPVATVSVSSLFEAVETGNTATQSFQVSNDGNNPLEYDVFAEALGLGPFAPSDVAAPPTTGSNAKSAASTELGALAAPTTASAKQAFDVSDFLYTLDDGSVETSLGISSGADIFWLNAFEAKEGATTITALASAFGPSQSVGSNVEFLLYEDPNDDGDPTDANLLRTVSTTTEVSGGNQLQIEPIPPTQVEGVFFVAVLVPSTANFPAPLDQSSDQGASWIANTSGTFNPSDLSQNPPSLTSDIGFPGNWVLRAQGAYAAFDPVSGTVAAGNADNVDVTFDGASLPTGRYQANAAVTSNDPATPRIDVPFTFFVADAVGEASLSSSNTSTAFDDGSPISPEPGLVVDLSDVSGSGTVTAMRFDDPPANVSGLATGESASEYRWFVRQDGDLTFDMQSEIRFRRADIPDPGFDATTADDVTVYRRASFGSGTFSDLTSDPDDGGTPNDLSDDAIVATGATAFSEFIFGSDTAPLPVEIASFDATRDGSAVTLSWQTASETNNAGFRLERKAQDEDGWTDVGSLIEGGGTTTRAQTYRHRVEGLSPTTYRFRLKSVSTEGTTSVGPTTTIEVRMESAYAVSPVRPNPVPERGRLTVQVREKQDVRVALYNVLGQAVRTLHDGPLPANTPRTMAIDGSSLASGVYFVRVQGETFQATRKITLAQ